MWGCVCIPGCVVGVSQHFITVSQELCLIFRMREPLFFRAQLRVLFFGLQLISCVPRTPRDSLLTSRSGLVCGNEGFYVRGHEWLICMNNVYCLILKMKESCTGRQRLIRHKKWSRD